MGAYHCRAIRGGHGRLTLRLHRLPRRQFYNHPAAALTPTRAGVASLVKWTWRAAATIGLKEGEGMRLPAADHVVIEAAKLHDYLLSPSHPVGRFKATFFARLGYTTGNWEQLETDLRALVQSQEAEARRPSPYGQKYEVRGVLGRPNARRVEMVTVWIVRRGEDVPRFVTAYPGEKP